MIDAGGLNSPNKRVKIKNPVPPEWVAVPDLSTVSNEKKTVVFVLPEAVRLWGGVIWLFFYTTYKVTANAVGTISADKQGSP